MKYKVKSNSRWHIFLAAVILLAAIFFTAFPSRAEGKNSDLAVTLSATSDQSGADRTASDDATWTAGKKLHELPEYKDKDYVIDAYDVHVRLQENNEMEITENLDVWFNQERHGIYRTIPLKNTVYRQDGSANGNRAKVEILSVSENYETEYEGDNYKLKLGDPDLMVIGEQKYTIRYNYKLGRDPLDGKDEFYINLIGSEWTNAISGITFTIEMPKTFDEKLLGFSAGWAGKADDTGVTWNVSGLVITGKYDGILEPGQALTVRQELPEGYFVDAGFENPVLDAVCFGLPVIFFFIALFLWMKYGRDDMVVETVEFYPPDGVNSLDAGFYYKGDVVGSDVTSLLIYLANKGYVRIEETEEKSIFRTKKTFRIVELKPYDGQDPNEELFLDGLFTGVREEGTLRSVTAGQLYDRFYVTTGKIMKKEREKAKWLFEKNTSLKSALIMIMILASAVLIFLPSILTYGNPVFVAFTLFPIFGFGFFFSLALAGKGKGRRKGTMKKGRALAMIMGVTFCILFSFVPTIFFIGPFLLENQVHLICFILDSFLIVGMILLFVFMPKRTRFGVEMLGRLEGFRNFLEVAEKQQLEQLVMQDPQYFYKILPYTYVLGVSDKWIRKFETINMSAPDWYYGSYYDLHDFGNAMDRTMETANRSMTSSPSESSGGGGGGGFSGGGSGGGGGGSW